MNRLKKNWTHVSLIAKKALFCSSILCIVAVAYASQPCELTTPHTVPVAVPNEAILKKPAETTPPETDSVVDILVPRIFNAASLPARCTIEKISDQPFIRVIHNFLTDEESDFLIEQARPLLKRSPVIGKENSEYSEHRTSRSAFLDQVKSPIMSAIQRRSALLVKTHKNNLESLQVVHYDKSQFFKPHHDYIDRSLPSAKNYIGTQGQRSATLLVYLNTIPEGVGGETLFPEVKRSGALTTGSHAKTPDSPSCEAASDRGTKILPRKNSAVFWYNVLPNGAEDTRTLHGGCAIDEGEKWATNIWIRNPHLINAVNISGE